MFNPVDLEFKGQNLSVPANRVLGLIASIEAHVNIVALNNPEKLSYASLARAYADAIKYAGGKATADEVYEELFGAGNSNVHAVIGNLMIMMLPPSALAAAAEEDGGEKKT